MKGEGDLGVSRLLRTILIVTLEHKALQPEPSAIAHQGATAGRVFWRVNRNLLPICRPESGSELGGGLLNRAGIANDVLS